jgi:hypothetical protein
MLFASSGTNTPDSMWLLTLFAYLIAFNNRAFMAFVERKEKGRERKV